MSGASASPELPALPPRWAWVSVAELAADEPRALADGPFGSNLKTEHYTASGPRVIRLQNVGEGEFLNAEAHISPQHFESLRAHEARPGDVVMASLGETLPRACVVPEWLGPAIVKADCPRLRLRRELNPDYVALALNSAPVRRQAEAVIHGVGRPRLKLAALKRLAVPIPPRLQQEQIAAALMAYRSRIDGGVESLASAQKARIPFTASLLHQELRERGWPSARLGDVCEVRSGIGFPKHLQGRSEGDLPFAKVRDISAVWLDGRTHLRGAAHFVDAEDLEELKGEPLPAGTVVMAKIGEAVRLNRRAVLSRPSLVDNNVMGWLPDRTVLDPDFLFLVSRTFDLSQWSQGGAVPSVRKSDVVELSLPVPPVDEQRQVVVRIRRQLTAGDELMRALTVAGRDARFLWRSLLESAVLSGLNGAAPSALATINGRTSGESSGRAVRLGS